MEFGEKLFYKVKRGSKLEKINERWEYGIFLGVRRKSDELWIGTREGIESPRSVKRIPAEQRWGEGCVNWIKWAPWRRYRDAVEVDWDLLEGVPAEEIIEAKNNRGTVIIETRERAPRESARKMLKSMDTLEVVGDVRVGLGDWQGSLIRQNAERDLGRQWLKMPR